MRAAARHQRAATPPLPEARPLYGISRRLGGVEFLAAHYSGHRFSPHSHATFAVGAVLRGACRIWHGGMSHLAIPGDLVLIEPGAPHSAGPAGGAEWDYCAVYFSVETAQQWSTPFPGRPGFQLVVGRDPDLAAGLRQLCIRFQHDPEQVQSEACFARFIGRLFARFGRDGSDPVSGPPDKVSAVVRQHLDTHFHTPVRIGQLAELTGRSPFGLIRDFSRAFGMPPYTYLTHTRIARAQDLLRAGRSISETAFAVGFSDQSHLTRFFRRIVGVPPGVWSRGVGIAGS